MKTYSSWRSDRGFSTTGSLGQDVGPHYNHVVLGHTEDICHQGWDALNLLLTQGNL